MVLQLPEEDRVFDQILWDGDFSSRCQVAKVRIVSNTLCSSSSFLWGCPTGKVHHEAIQNSKVIQIIFALHFSFLPPFSYVTVVSGPTPFNQEAQATDT